MGGTTSAAFFSDDLPEDRNLVSLCEVCHEPSAYRCSRCKLSKYCGDPCRKEAWECHRFVCKGVVTKFRDDMRPSPYHFRTVILSRQDFRPRLFWLDTKDKFALSTKHVSTIFSIHILLGGQRGQFWDDNLFLLPDSKQPTRGKMRRKHINKTIDKLGKPDEPGTIAP